MPEYTDRAAAIAKIDPDEYYHSNEIKTMLRDIPAAEVVEVVRCRECKHSRLPAVLTQKYGKPGTLTCNNIKAPCNHRNVNEKDFCSYGERRGDACMLPDLRWGVADTTPMLPYAEKRSEVIAWRSSRRGCAG